MLGRSCDREAIEAEIDRVRSLGLDELRTLWRTTLRSSPPPAFTKDLMARFLCWHIQEQTLVSICRARRIRRARRHAGLRLWRRVLPRSGSPRGNREFLLLPCL